ncbi:LexA family transcriptional regulator [Marinobacter salinisoli]|uniref:LexA family transcriptional regulator n=1 Tax=Marinobacter salinisoli TaxID=2769486 RepID=A0ABX7MQD7_9GAMM|nr:SulA-like leucine-rich domain-containing protein [Marinobacter salinisoli]QSP94418.1 LexA family transcriptional regulator [Marinobacter salinisoli]
MEQLSFGQNTAFHQGALSYPVSSPVTPKKRAVIAARPRGETRAAPGAGNVTEIIMPREQVESFQLLLPMLTQLNQEKRWLAWIDPPQALVSKWQKMHGIVAGQLLVLRSTPEYSAQALAERALSAGTCHAVVMWTQKLSKSAFQELQQASAMGNSHGVVLRQR